jgi:hypothetical protein
MKKGQLIANYAITSTNKGKTYVNNFLNEKTRRRHKHNPNFCNQTLFIIQIGKQLLVQRKKN